MRKIFFCAMVFLCAASFAAAEDDLWQETHKNLKDQAFVIETDEDSRAESLNRVSGQYDLGFSAPDQSYESTSHYRPGPFGREQAKDNLDQSY